MVTTLTKPARTGHGPTRAAWFVVAVVVLVAAAGLSVMVGANPMSPGTVLDTVLGGGTDESRYLVWDQRIPRTAAGLAVGAALGVAGALIQAFTRNPLADPGILGVNVGASLFVVSGMAYFGLAAATPMIWVAILGAGVTALVVYTIGSLGRGGATPLKLALAGAATSAALASIVTAVILPRNDIAGGVRSWQIGGVGGASLDSIRQVAPFLLVGFALCLLSARALNALALGDDLAAGLGERVAAARGAAALGAVILSGACTAVTGPIGFVGLVVPHACRLLVGVDHRWLLPFSALTGAALLTGADVVGRIVARPGEVDVGIITALIGAPFFIYIVRRSKVRAL